AWRRDDFVLRDLRTAPALRHERCGGLDQPVSRARLELNSIWPGKEFAERDGSRTRPCGGGLCKRWQASCSDRKDGGRNHTRAVREHPRCRIPSVLHHGQASWGGGPKVSTPYHRSSPLGPPHPYE